MRELTFFILASLILTYPLVTHLDQAVYTTSDSLHSAWILDRNVFALRQGKLKDFFNANTFYPYKNTLAYSDHLIGQTFLAGPIIYFTNNPILAQNILIILSFAFSGITAFWLFNYWLKNRLAALIPAFAFAFANFRFQQLEHLNILTSFWLPLVFLFLQKWLDRQQKRDLFFFGIFYFLTILSSLHYALMTSLALLAYWLFSGFFLSAQNFRRNKVWPVAIVVAVVLLVSAPTLYSYLKLKQEFPEISRSIRDNMAGSASLSSFLFSATSTRIARLTWFEHLGEADAGLFPGFTFLILLAFGWRKAKKQERFFLAMSILFLIFSFGPVLRLSHKNNTSLPLPYLLFYLLLPPLRVMRTPVRWYLFSLLFAGYLVGRGVAALMTKWPAKKFWLTAILLIFLALESFSLPLDLVLVSKKEEFPQVYQWLAQQPEDFAVLELPIPNLVDPSISQKKKQPYGFLKNLTPHEYDTIEAYRQYFSSLHRKKLINGYSGFFPPIYLEVLKKSQNFASPEFLRFLRDLEVKYLIIHAQQLTLAQREEALPLLLENKELNLMSQFEDQDYVFAL